MRAGFQSIKFQGRPYQLVILCKAKRVHSITVSECQLTGDVIDRPRGWEERSRDNIGRRYPEADGKFRSSKGYIRSHWKGIGIVLHPRNPTFKASRPPPVLFSLVVLERCSPILSSTSQAHPSIHCFKYTMATSTAGKYTSKLHNKRVLVLGGTSGMGFCVAEASVESGATVVVSGSRQPKIDATIERIKASYPDCGARLSGHACDLANTESLEQNIESLLKFATSDGKEKLDHVVFTAGDSFSVTGLADTTVESIQKLGTVRFTAAILLGKLLVPGYMTSSAESSMTLTGGVNSTKPGAGWSVMAGYGAAIEGLARGLAVDLKPIRVNCVAPGAVNTELMRSFSGGRLDAVLNHFRDMTTTGTVGRPEDLAEAYLYCMKDKFVTGAVLHSSGGALLT